MARLQVKCIIIIRSVCLSLIGLAITSCCSIFPRMCQCDLAPPANTDNETTAKANAAAGAISKAIANGSASVEVDHVVKNTYVQIDKDDVAFYILVKAADCASARGDKEGAREWRRQASIALAQRHQTPAQPPTNLNALSKTDQRLLKNSPLKDQISSKVNALRLQ